MTTARIERLEEICEGVSRAIDADRGTRYWSAGRQRGSGIFRGLARWNKIHIGAFVSVAEVATDAIGAGTYTVWDAADYYLSPANAVLQGLPYTEIERTPQTTKAILTAAAWRTRDRQVGIFGRSAGRHRGSRFADSTAGIRETAYTLRARLRARRLGGQNNLPQPPG